MLPGHSHALGSQILLPGTEGATGIIEAVHGMSHTQIATGCILSKIVFQDQIHQSIRRMIFVVPGLTAATVPRL